MADSKISALPASTVPLAGTEVLPIVQSSATKQVSVANLTAGRSVSVADLAVSTGNIVPGTAAKGINFTANTSAAGMTSKLLNDYEEGTWTPTDGSGAGLSLTVSNATYTKIGRMVYASAQVAYPVTASTAQAILASLPFAVGTVPGTGVPNTPVTSSSLQLQINVKSINNAEIDIYPTAAGVTNAQLSGVAFISFTLIYPST
jgi:hypothetical protein